MQRDVEVYLDDIRVSCEKIERYTEALTLEAFIHDEKTVDAVLRNFTVIGEAAKRVPDDVRQRFPTLDWKRICGFRDVLVHDYPSINLRVVWDIVRSEVPELLAALERSR